MAGVRLAAATLALIAYAVLSHLLMTRWPDQPWAVAVLFGPLLAGMAASGLARRHAPTLLGCAAITAALVAVVMRGGVGVNLLYVLQHGAIHGLLALTFGLTLRPGHEALITQMAHRVHENPISPVQAAYTRWLTAVWTAYFAAMIVVSLVVYVLAPWPVWSVFCNAITPLAAAALFAGEHVARQWRHPEFERVTLRQVMRVYQTFGSTR